jgi:hypothetical protein
MRERKQRHSKKGWGIIGAMLILCDLGVWANAAPRKHPPLTTVTVVVTEAGTEKPIFQARLTLEFRDPDSRRGKTLSYNAKTDINGKYKFSFIPMEPILIVVTAPDHQSFGRQFQITQQDQVIHIKLRKPQPLR